MWCLHDKHKSLQITQKEQNKSLQKFTIAPFFIYRFLLILIGIIYGNKLYITYVYLCDCMVWWFTIAPFLFTIL